jgi:L,D-transpeptidase catalytic domain
VDVKPAAPAPELQERAASAGKPAPSPRTRRNVHGIPTCRVRAGTGHHPSIVKTPLPIFVVAAAPYCVAAIALGNPPQQSPAAIPALTGPRLLPVHELSERSRAPRHTLAAALRAPVVAYDAPGGRALARLGSRTDFGSPRVVPVTGRRGAWLRVLQDTPDGRSAWIRPAGGIVLQRRNAEIVIDRSRRTLTLLERDRAVRRLPVAVGDARSPTPLGRFSVTDRLSGAPYRGVYGCCVLALSGRQKRLPPGWTGGNRLAIHASERPHPTEGVSAGCVVASDEALRYLMRRVALGTVVTIRR